MFLYFGWYDLVKLFKIKGLIRLSLVVYEYAVHQLEDIIVSHILSDKFWYFLQLFKSNFSRLLLIIQVKHSPNSVLGFAIACLLTYNINEFIKVQDFILFSQGPDYVQYVGVAIGKPQLFEHFHNLLRVNWATSILVKDQEDISQLLIVISRYSVLPSKRNLLFDRLGGWTL